MVITVFGLGFVGLTTALGFAEIGHKIYGVECNEKRSAMISSGKVPFMEPGVDEALARHLNKSFFICEDLEESIAASDCVYYCVGTPYGENGQADLDDLYKAIEQTLKTVCDDKFRVLVIKSTIPPTTTLSKIIPFVEAKGFKVGTQIGVSNNPEFLREGYCWDDFMKADRIVLGVNDYKSEEMLCALYSNMNIPVVCVSPNTGEFIKYLSNTLLATLVSFSNEMSLVADTFGGIDVSDAFRTLHMDKRWGNGSMKSYAYPGCGYGGYCLPKDTNALYAAAKYAGFDAKILKNVIRTNDAMPEFIVDRIIKCADYSQTKTIGILGLTFKPGSDDTRDAPSAKVIKALNDNGYTRILAYDPVGMPEFQTYYKMDYRCVDSYAELIERADILVIATAWPDFKNIKELTDKNVVDCRYML